uniref:Protein GRIP n=1 Tax=Anthurium amnicola TaxID=1678845 RepID=A0A1D1ZHY7_9ARAE
MENGIRGEGDDTEDQLTQTVAELAFQNDYLKAQFEALRKQLLIGVPAAITGGGEVEGGQGGESPREELARLREEIGALKTEIHERSVTQKAAKDALEHLRASYSEADARAQELSAQLAEAQQKMEQEIKMRDDKYTELDSKFGRLHKRAKQRIQEIQKEKDDLEAHLRDVKEKAEQASALQSSAHQELERTLQQANEALRSMDIEKQQLRSSNIKLRENIDELHRTLEAKENALEGLQQSHFEKEQMLEDTQNLLKSAEEKRQASIADLSAKHQKIVESLEAQLADVLSDRSKAAETITSLQVLIVEKDSKISELDAASTGEAVRLSAAVEAAKQELIHLKNEHEKERECWDTNCQALKNKLEASESACLRSEIEAAKTRCQLESELSLQNHMLNTREAELATAKEEISRLESEFSSYKVRAHALLQKKEAELSAARDADVVKVQEEAVKEAEREAALALAERDKALQNLKNVITKHDTEIAARDVALADAHERIKSITLKFDSINAQYQSDKESWQKNFEDLEESWRLRYDTLEAQNSMYGGHDLKNQLEELKLLYKKLKEEHDTFCDISDRMMEEKEREIVKLTEENKTLRHSEQIQHVNNNNSNNNSTDFSKQDSQGLSIAAAEQQILLLARQQAQREEELAQSQRHILALQEEIEELERENRLHSQQETMLKEEFRNMERKQKREGVDMTYLKNVILKLLETGEVEALLPVVGMLLQFSPEELRRCQQVYSSLNSLPSGLSASPTDTAASTPRSLFSRFSFT